MVLIIRPQDMEHIQSVQMEVNYYYIKGSWSSTDSGKNNTVTAFSYYKGDTVTVEYLPDQSKIVFRKKGT